MKMKLQYAPDVQEKASDIVRELCLTHIDTSRVIFLRSHGSTANAYARIWELPRIWQMALDVKPHYVIEVLSEHFDKQTEENKERTIIHELLHISKNFTGSLVPHNCFGEVRVGHAAVEKLHCEYKKRRA